MIYCDKHIPLDGCIPGDEVMVRRDEECPTCVREERDRLREKVNRMVDLLNRRMHCDICECHGCQEIQTVVQL